MSLDGKIVGHLQLKYNTPIDGIWSTLVVSPYDKIMGHLQPQYNTPIEGD